MELFNFKTLALGLWLFVTGTPLLAQAAKACHGVHRAGGPVGDVRGTNIRLINQLIHPEVSFDHALALIESMPLSRTHGSTVFSNVRHEALIPIIEGLTRKGIAIDGTPFLDYNMIALHQVVDRFQGQSLLPYQTQDLRRIAKKVFRREIGEDKIDRNDPVFWGIVKKQIVDLIETMDSGLAQQFRQKDVFSLRAWWEGTWIKVSGQEVRGECRQLFVDGIHPEAQLRILLAFLRNEHLTQAEAFYILERLPIGQNVHVMTSSRLLTSAFKDARELAALRPRTFKIPLAIVVLAETLAHHDRFEAQGYRRLKLGYLVSRVLRTELATLPEDSPPGLADVLRDLIKSVARSHSVSEE